MASLSCAQQQCLCATSQRNHVVESLRSGRSKRVLAGQSGRSCLRVLASAIGTRTASPSTKYGGKTKPTMWFQGRKKAQDVGSTCNVAINIPSISQPLPVSKSDEEFEDLGLEFVWGSDTIDLQELNSLFAAVGFPRRDEKKLRTALDNTHTTLWMRACKPTRWATKNQVLGFARATTDKALTATIWDVSVHPAWQRLGAGRGLVERLVAALQTQDVPVICLYAETHVIKLYERIGFELDYNDQTGMGFVTRSENGQRVIAAAVQLQ